MRFNWLHTITLFFLLVASTLEAQRVSVQASVDSTTVKFGSQFQLRLTATYPPDANFQSIDVTQLEAIKDTLEVVVETDWDSTSVGRELLLKKELTLQAWQEGNYWIPAIPFIFTQNGTQQIYQTNRIPISVLPIGAKDLPQAQNSIVDSTQIADIKDIIREQANWRDYLPFILTFLLIGIVALGYYFWKKQQEAKEAPPTPEIKLPAHEIALNALNQLRGEKLWQRGEIKAYQSRLTHIIRAYLENRYEVPALESTTDEILRNLKRVDFDNSWKEKLQNILQVADLVKFAKAKPPADFHDKVLQDAENFVIATKEKPITIETEGESL